MPHHPSVTLSGDVTHVFAHRFVLTTERGAVLADLTPHGRDIVRLQLGERVTITGEQKPSEVKVSTITRGAETVAIEHHGPPGAHHEPADPTVALDAVRRAGFKAEAAPRRKPKHFEILGVKGGRFEELHVELDGHIRKTKPADPRDPKWQVSAAD